MVSDMINLGVIHGRFQVLHNDHLAYLLLGKTECQHLIIGITNPDPSHTSSEPVDPSRSLPESNPLTYYERHTLITAALIEAEVPQSEFSIVPMPINYPQLLRYYVPLQATYFLSIYDNWGKRKKELLENLGLSVQVLSQRPESEKGLSASNIRRSIADDEPWTHLVPPVVSRLLGEYDIQSRIRCHSGITTNQY